MIPAIVYRFAGEGDHRLFLLLLLLPLFTGIPRRETVLNLILQSESSVFSVSPWSAAGCWPLRREVSVAYTGTQRAIDLDHGED